MEKPGFQAFSRGFPVDNHVDNVDFPGFHAMYIHKKRTHSKGQSEKYDRGKKIVAALVTWMGYLV